MKRTLRPSAFALVATLVMMALIFVVVVAYLANTRSDRSTSSIYANRLRAKMTADSGLAAAMNLLYENTKNGNYITAMPAFSPSPAPLRTELYRPQDTTDFLHIGDAIGEMLVSRGDQTTTPPPASQVDPRPAPTPMPTPGTGNSFGITDPALAIANSFDFNQAVRVGTTDGRLVEPAPSPTGGPSATPRPALGEWVRVRNSDGELIGRYAFFIEDESMKVNVNVTGNRRGTGQTHLRVNDLVSPSPTPTPPASPTPQVDQIFPSAVLPTGSNRQLAVDKLTAEGTPPSRLPTSATIALLDEWKQAYPEYAHLLTMFSSDDNTTARGWLRLNVNKVVADAEAVGTNAAKVAAAHKISDWIKDAWTGPTPIASLHQDPDGNNYQLYNDDRLRLQIAASIVDYIDADNLPTDLGDIAPGTSLTPVPVIGIERIPHIENVMVIYQAKDRAAVAGSSPARTSAKMSMKLRFNFINMFGDDLDLAMPISPTNSSALFDRIEVLGIPVITKISEKIFDKKAMLFKIPISSLRPVVPKPSFSDSKIAAGQDGVSASGVRSFETDWLVQDELVQFRAASGNPIFSPVDQMTVTIFGSDNARIESTAMTWIDTPNTGFRQSGSTTPGSDSAGDFLRDEPAGAIPGVTRQIAALFHQESVVTVGSSTLTRQFGDPRYRPTILNERWRRQNRTDTESAFGASALSARVDDADMAPRTAGFDWYDHISDRPLTFIRNGPMLSVGELGHIAAAEYPWRSLYLQHPDRPTNSSSATVVNEVSTLRRMGAVDWVLPDLFRVSDSNVASGRININTTFQASDQQRVLDALVLSLPIGDHTATQQTVSDVMARLLTTSTNSGLLASVSVRRSGSPLTPENDPIRPFFQIGESAAALSRLFSLSKLVVGESRSTVSYSVLRSTPEDPGEVNANYRSDMLAEQAFREISDSITTRGNVFRVLYVGQAIQDVSRNGVKNGLIDGPEEIRAEFLGEAFVARTSTFTATGTNPDAKRTSDSRYTILASRVITE